MARCRFGYFLLLLPLLELEANPSDPNVLSGHASCISTPQKLEVSAHDKTIISWKDFSIGSKETTHFNLPSSRSIILNRVSSHNISKIEGLLSSNGIVYLINPNGVVITPTGKIDTAGFLASTLNITDQDFLNGSDILFTGSSGSITNLGTIRCSSGDVILMACQVKNEGTIEAPEGAIALGAAQEILMTLQGEERLTVRLPPPAGGKEEIGVHQTGSLEALQAELKADGNLFAYAIKNEGHINATATVQRNGRIYLVAEKGLVTSSGTLTAPGGEVRILGQIASLTDNAQIDVSQNKGGGTILIGGDYKGGNSDILNAEFTSVDPEVSIKADALIQGNGGKVILWGDKETYFYGNISAQGGPQSGDGGFVEVSGKYLNYQGMTTTYAPLGTAGTLLLDPITVTISTGTDTGTFNACPTGTYNYVSPATVINIANLLTHLLSCNVTIDSSATGAGTGTITIANPLTLPTGSNNLTLTNATVANADILINAVLENDSSGNIIFNAGRNITFNTGIGYTQTGSGSAIFAANQTTAGSFSMTATSPLNVSGGTGNITITASAITISGTTTLSSPGFFSATSKAGTNTINGTISSIAGGSFTVSGTGTVTINGTAGTTSSFAAGSVVTISSSGSGATLSNTTGSMTFAPGSGSLTVNAHGAIILKGPLTYASSGPCEFASASFNNSAGATMNFNSSSGPIAFYASSGIGLTGGATNSSASPLTVTCNSLTLGAPLINNSTFTGISLCVTSYSGFTFTQPFSSSSPGASIFNTASPGELNISSGGSITTTGSGSLTLRGFSFNGNPAMEIAGPINYNSSGPFQAIGVDAGIQFTSGGSITFGANAGPASLTAFSGITFEAITNNSANPLTIIARSVAFNGPLTNNSTFTGTSLFVNTTGGISFGGSPGGFTSSSNGDSVFFTSGGFSIGAALSFITTPPTTGSGGNVSISTGTNISILCPITLGTTGAFSATAQAGNVAISGSIQSTAGGPFNVSALGAAGSITLSSATSPFISFSPGSAVNLFSVGVTTLSATTMIFGAGAGSSLTVGTPSAPVGSIAINGALNYSSLGPCQFVCTGNLANNAIGAMTFLSGCGDATFESTASTVTFNATAPGAQITFQSGAGNAFVTTSPGTGDSMTIGPFDFESGSGKAAIFNSNSALTFGGDFTYDNSSNICNMTSVGLLTVGPSTFNLSTSSLNMTSTAGGITTLTTGPITVASGAGALTMSAFGAITLGGTLTDNSATSPLSMTTTSATGDILINNTITTSGNGSVNATAGGNITLGTGINYTQAVGTGTFIAGRANSAGAFSTSTTSTLATSGSAILSITGAEPAGTAAISILGPLSPASSGAFSATATTGNLTITGAITATGGGTFNLSAVGPSAAVTLNATGTDSFTGSAVSLSAGTGGVILSATTSTTFAAGAGSLTVNSVGPVAIYTALTYASTGNCQFTSTGGSITNSGILTFNTGSGPISFTANTIANQAITVGAAITNNSASSLTTISSGTTVFNANLTNASTLSTGTSLSVTAGGNISFNALQGFTSSSPAASHFIANQAALGSFSTATNSFLTTTSTAGAVSITAANATGATAVNILCPITLASTGAFSATANTGNVVISGAISNTTTGGTFNVSAPGESGAITLSNTINFSPGSAASLASAGLTMLSGATMTFGGTSGSLTVGTTLAPVGSIAINGALSYSSPGACQFIASGAITNNASGVMSFNSGSGAVTFESTTRTISFNATPAITFNAGAGSVTVKTDTGTGGAITVGPFTFNSSGSQTALFNSNSTLTFNGAFSYGGSSATSTLTSAGLLTLNGALGLNAAGAFSMTSTGDGLTTTTSGPITVAPGAGPLTMSAVGTLTLGAALADSSTNLLTMTTTGVIGDILINAALTTSGSANLTAARNLTFNTGIGYIQSAGTGTFLAGQAAEGLFSISSLLQTSGTAILSITSSNAPASSAITIGALTLASSGAFSATATQGNVAISGAISSTAGGSFSVSAPGSVGSITLSGTTTSFTPGSVVSLTAAGSTALSGTSTFGSGGSGSLAISGSTAGVTISGPLTYDTTGAFLISSSGSTITTTPAGTLTVSAGSGLTMTANGLITVGGTVLYNSSDVSGFAATSTMGGITITAPVTVSTTAPLSLTATAAGQQVLIQNQVTNSSTGNITVTASNLTLHPVAGSTASAELGTLSGALALTNVTQVSLSGGTAAGAFAQLGYNTGSPTSNINFTNCHSLLMQSGTAANCYTLVGHGSPSAGALTLAGNITISGTGNLTMGTSGNGANCFSQIGHVQSLTNNTSATGAISVNLGGAISMTGGSNTNTYALIGHGGVNSTSTNSYTGDVSVVAGGNIVLETRSTGSGAFAAIGPTSISNGTVTITGSHTISATSTSGSIILQPATSNECVIGAYVRGSGANTINPLTITVTTGQDLILTGAPNPGASLSGALIGALAYTGAVPFAPPGTSTSTLNVNIGRNLEMQTGAGGANTTTFTAIQNGLGGAPNAVTVNVTGSTTLMGGNNLSTITSLGALTLNGTGDVMLLSDQTAASSGTASLIGNGNTSVTGNGVWLTGALTGPQALIQNSTGNLSVASNSMTLASNGNILLSGGAGTLTVNAATGDLNLNSLASIQNLGSGPTSMTVGATVSMTAGAGNVMIFNNTGALTMNINDNLNLITNTGGSASITSNGPISITAQNMALFGLGMGEQSLIQTTLGDILLMAMNDITLDDNALITNAGLGNLTLVADQQAPLPPQIGLGRFILNPDANITTAGGLLQVFAASPNGIPAGNLAFGDLNTRPATETVICPFDKPAPTDKNVYVTYFDTFISPVGAEGNPYTLYYKTFFIPPVPPIPPTPPTPIPQPVLVRNLSKISFASAQIFTFLKEYPEYPRYKSDEMEFYLECQICRKRGKRFCMDVDDRYPYIRQNWTLYPIGL